MQPYNPRTVSVFPTLSAFINIGRKTKVKNKEALIEALEVFVNELMETAQVAHEIKSKLAIGPEAIANQFGELKKKAGMESMPADMPN
ncbi:hypothetical protein L0222_31715 [bacterium]|nr:hypothetical protein [bacterium]